MPTAARCKPRLPERLATPDQRIDLATAARARGAAGTARGAVGARGLAAGELLLIGRRHQRDNNSWLHNLPGSPGAGPGTPCSPTRTTWPRAASATATRCSCGRRWGRCASRSTATDDVMPGVVSLPHGYGHARPGVRLRHATRLPGVSVNDLTDPAVVEGVSGNAVLNGVPVTVEPLAVAARRQRSRVRSWSGSRPRW